LPQACQEFRDQISGFENEELNIQEEMHGATPTEKTRLMEKLRNLGKAKSEIERRLAECERNENVWHRLNFIMQRQQQTNWCVAACACSINAYYDPNSTFKQCDIPNAEFNRTDCCTNGSSKDCNKPLSYSQALSNTRNLRSWKFAPVTMDYIEDQIYEHRPIGAGITWSEEPAPGEAKGHAVVITGYNMGLDSFAIEDPFWGKLDISLDTFTNYYRGHGKWTHTYYTQR
jgi:hypothetical protein